MHGQCLCGEVKFQLTGPRPRLYQCHCTLCRKQGGSASNTATIVPKEEFRWLAGEALIGTWMKDTGFRSHFCTRCGSTVPNPLRDTPYFWVPAGLLEDTGPLEIVTHIYVGSRAPWDTAPLSGTLHDTDMREFAAALRGR